MATEALKACDILAKRGVLAGILLLELLKPYDQVASEIAGLLPKGACKLVFLEEEVRVGGMGMLLSDALSAYAIMKNKEVDAIALDHSFGIQTKNEPIHASFGMDAENIVSRVLQ